MHLPSCLASPPFVSSYAAYSHPSLLVLLAIQTWSFSTFSPVDCIASHSLASGLSTLPARRRTELDMTRRDPVKLRVANQKAYLWDLNGSSFCSLRLEFDETRRARLAHTKSLGMPRAYRCAIPPSAASYLRRPLWNSAASDAAERLSRTPARLDAGRGRPPRPKRSVPSHEQRLIAKIRIAALTPPV